MTQTILSCEYVDLIPFDCDEDYSYLADMCIAHKYNPEKNKEVLLRLFDCYGFAFFNVIRKSDNKKLGCVYSYKLDGYMTIDSIKDNTIDLKDTIKYSLDVAKIMIAYLFEHTDTIVTCHDHRDRAVKMLTKKVGFKYTKDIKAFNTIWNFYELKRGDLCQ